MKSFVIAVCCLSLACLVGIKSEAIAQTNLCDPIPQQATCSFTSINGSCQIIVDRANAISFPTIYMKPGSQLTVFVYNASPFETLTLDLTSLTAALRPDTFQTVFNSLTPNASKATGLATAQALVPQLDLVQIVPLPAGPLPAKTLDDLVNDSKTALYAQNGVIDETDASLVLPQIGLAAQGPTGQSCFLSTATTNDEFPNPWFQTVDWKKTVLARLTTASGGTVKKAAGLQTDATSVQNKIDAVAQFVQDWNDYTDPKKTGYHKLSSSDQQKLENTRQILKTLKLQQGTLNAKITARGDTGNGNNEQARLNALSAVISSISTAASTAAKVPGGTQNIVAPFVINVPKNGKAFNISGAWALNYSNALSGIVAQVSQATYTPSATVLASSYSLLGSPATKTQAMSVTIQSTNKEWIEASAGFVVPWRAYHSYTAAAQDSNGSVVTNVVQRTLTHTVVPAAFVNINLLEIPNRHGSWAFFLTPFVGYNATTSAVETGIGPSFSWRSIELNLMADYASDTYLAGGFTVGQSLGASNPASPLTKNAYSWRFAPGISIRIPLGGGSSSPTGATGATASPSAASSGAGGSGGGGKHH